MPGALLTRGQPFAAAAVERAIRTERPPHALLLVGPTGAGKTTLAYDLAAGLLCTASPARERPCGRCLACRKVRAGTHPDVHRLAPAGPGGQVRLPQVHELQAALALHPLEGTWRIAIVEAAHRLNQDAQNALLKTLEEPPGHTVIVLAAEDESLLLPTVRSRCARLRLNSLPSTAIVELLASEAGVEAPRAALLGRLAAGRPGLALALGRDQEAEIAYGRLARTLLDLAVADRRTRLAAASGLLADASIIAGATDPPGSLAATSTAAAPGAGRSATRQPPPAERRRALLGLLEAWRELARDLAVAAHAGPRPVRAVDLLEEIVDLAERSDPSALTAFLGRLDGLAGAVDAYANPELVLDVLLLEWPRPRGSGAGARSNPAA